jgi:hypothetical protein
MTESANGWTGKEWQVVEFMPIMDGKYPGHAALMAFSSVVSAMIPSSRPTVVKVSGVVLGDMMEATGLDRSANVSHLNCAGARVVIEVDNRMPRNMLMLGSAE